MASKVTGGERTAMNGSGVAAAPLVAGSARIALWALATIILTSLALAVTAPQALRSALAGMTGCNARDVASAGDSSCALCARDPGAAAPECCDADAAPAAAVPAPRERPDTPEERINPDREVVFSVERLGCTLVQGVGCGHLLAPTLARLDQVEGVARSYTNWTGTRLRVSVAAKVDRDAVAARVRERLARQQYGPKRVDADELAETLRRELWRDVGRVSELSSFEFHTHAKRRVNEFARREGLGKDKTARLQSAIDDLWAKSREGRGPPPSDDEAYAAYWNDRIHTYKSSLLKRAADVLTKEQTARLAAESER